MQVIRTRDLSPARFAGILRSGALTAAALCIVALATGAASAQAAWPGLKIVAPRSIGAGTRLHYATLVSGPARRVSFYVDGKRRWSRPSHGRRFERRGYLRATHLAVGPHQLAVAVRRRNGNLVRTRRTIRISKRSERGTWPNGNGHHKESASAEEPTSFPSSEKESTSQPAPEAEVETQAGVEEEAIPQSEEPAPKAEAAPGLIFDGAHIGDYWMNQSAPGTVTEVPDPAGSGETVMKMTVSNEDVYPITPTSDPRAQLLSPDFIEPGDEFWWSGKFFLPSDFPTSVPGWLTVMEGAYGPPFEGTPPWHIEVNGEELRWQRNSTYNWDIPWRMPLVRNRWVSVVVHEGFGTNGFIEMWIDGQQVSFFGPGTYNPAHEAETRRLGMKTMDKSNDGGPNFTVIQSYRKANMFETVTLFHGPMRIGTTQASVTG